MEEGKVERKKRRKAVVFLSPVGSNEWQCSRFVGKKRLLRVRQRTGAFPFFRGGKGKKYYSVAGDSYFFFSQRLILRLSVYPVQSVPEGRRSLF